MGARLITRRLALFMDGGSTIEGAAARHILFISFNYIFDGKDGVGRPATWRRRPFFAIDQTKANCRTAVRFFYWQPIKSVVQWAELILGGA